VQIEVSLQPVATNEVGRSFFEISVSPNPSTETSILTVYSEKEQIVALKLLRISGALFVVEKQINDGENRISLSDYRDIPAGFYFVEGTADGQRKMLRWINI